MHRTTKKGLERLSQKLEALDKKTEKKAGKLIMKLDFLDKIADLFVMGKDPKKLPRVGFIGIDYKKGAWVVGSIQPPYKEKKGGRFVEGRGVAQYT
jgi:hypothetical protein